MSVAASKCGEGRCAMQKVGKEGVITVEENKSLETEVDIVRA
jgi:hypothetical protein